MYIYLDPHVIPILCVPRFVCSLTLIMNRNNKIWTSITIRLVNFRLITSLFIFILIILLYFFKEDVLFSPYVGG